MYQDMKIIDFIKEVDSDSPAPGGGSVAALCGSLGVSLSRMYGHLSIHKKRFQALDETTQTKFNKAFEGLEAIQYDLLSAIDKDSEAYNTVMDAIHLPKETKDQQAIRKQAMDQATIQAIESPYHIMKLAYQAMDCFMDIIPYGNKNAVSDIAVAVLMLDTAIKSAGYNVRINLSSIADESTSNQWKTKMDELLQKSENLKNTLIQEAEKYL